MSVFGRYLDAYDVSLLLTVMIFAGATLILIKQPEVTIETILAAYAGVTTVAGGLIVVANKFTKKPECNKLDCANRSPSLELQGWQK